MTVNHYFNHLSHSGERNLRQDLVVEIIQMGGIDVYYIKRDAVVTDDIFGEHSTVKYEDYDVVEMIIEDADEGIQNEQLSLFGLDIQDRVELTVARSRFASQIGFEKPREGDLVYIPAPFDSVWEVVQVPPKIFAQFGRQDTWTLKCEKFTYSQDDVTPLVGEDDITVEDDPLTGLEDMFQEEYDDSEDLQEEGQEMDLFDTKSPFGSF